MDKILCFGDSNTYGYDPRGYLGGRYPADIRWTGRLAEAGFSVKNCGQNGLTIPAPGEAACLTDRLGAPEQWHTVTVMLGTNDLLQSPSLSAEDVAARMERFLAAVTQALPPDRLLLIAPVPMVRGEWVTDACTMRESARLGSCFAAVADRLGARFADAAQWGVSLCFDGVHFTAEGHAAFAAGLLGAIKAGKEGLFNSGDPVYN